MIAVVRHRGFGVEEKCCNAYSKGDHDAPVSMTDVPVAISGAGGKTACANVRRQLVDLLNYVEAEVVGGEGEGFALPAAAWTDGVYEIPEWDKSRLALQAEDLLAAISR